MSTLQDAEQRNHAAALVLSNMFFTDNEARGMALGLLNGAEPSDDEPTECRKCGEIAPCSGPGLCDPCLNHIRRNIPEARL